MANIVAIVGRPNVGKSTFFNRLVEERKAIMDDVSGVTRDRHYGYAEWSGRQFTVIDTGGYVPESLDVFEEAIRDQVKLAMEEASVILFMVDTMVGITPTDKEFANILRLYKKPIYVIANKAETTDRYQSTHEFFALGLGEINPVSAQTGFGTGDLLDKVISHFPDIAAKEDDEIPRISILGRPNVGKSSFLNTLLGKERSIVTDIAGTTRDSIDTTYNAYGKKFILTDTAGIRKKSKIKENVEFYSILRSLKALEDSDVCIVMLDATRGLESQDVSIIGLAHKARKGIVIMVNKWDLIEKETMTSKKFEDEILEGLATMNYIPIIFTSVLTKKRIFQTLEKAVEVYENKNKRINTALLNEVMLKEIENQPPPSVKGKYIRIKYTTQLPTRSPSFAFFCNLPQYIKDPYARYLENKIRKHFGFEGVPIQVFFRKK